MEANNIKRHDIVCPNCGKIIRVSFDRLELKFISFRPGVIRTDITDKVIYALDPYFEAENHPITISSVLRDPEQQVRIIRDYALKYELIYKGIEFSLDKKIILKDKEFYEWQWAWSELLEKDILIAPPLKAEILSGRRKGQTRNPSKHFSGIAFDIDGESGDFNTPIDEFNIVNKAKEKDEFLKENITLILLERNNNCVHIECKEEKQNES